jgi:hypothetical protein
MRVQIFKEETRMVIDFQSKIVKAEQNHPSRKTGIYQNHLQIVANTSTNQAKTLPINVINRCHHQFKPL